MSYHEPRFIGWLCAGKSERFAPAERVQHPGLEEPRFDSNGLDIADRFGMVLGMRRITHSCGHEQEHYIIGEYAADYDSQAAKLSRGKCDTCRTQAASLIASQNRTAVQELGLAALQGSPKQIAWAETIRAKRLSALRQHDSEAALAVAQVTDARWWIDRRSEPDAVMITSAQAMRR